MKSLLKLALTLTFLASGNSRSLSAGIRRQDNSVEHEIFGGACKFGNISGDFGRVLAKEIEEGKGMDDFANFEIALGGKKRFIVSCNFESVIFGDGSEEFLSKTVFVNSNFTDVKTLAGANMVSIGSSYEDSIIEGGLILSEKKRINNILFGSDDVDPNSKDAIIIKDVFKRLGYNPPVIRNSTINNLDAVYMAQMLRGAILDKVNIKKWKIDSHIGGVPIYGCLGSLDLQATEFSDFTGAKSIGIEKKVYNYQQYISKALADELSKNEKLIYVVADANIGDYKQMSSKDKELFIKIFNVIFNRFNIIAIDQGRFNNSQSPYGYINLSRTLKEDYSGFVSKIEVLPKSSIIELEIAGYNVIVHELLHFLGGMHPWRGEGICLSALSSAKSRGVLELNSPGPLDYKFMFSLMEASGRDVKKVDEDINRYIYNKSIDTNIYLPGDEDNKNCSQAFYKSSATVRDVDLELVSQDQVKKLCDSKKGIPNIKTHRLSDNKNKGRVYMSVDIAQCWHIAIFDHNNDSKLFYIPAGIKGSNYRDPNFLAAIIGPLGIITCLLIAGRLKNIVPESKISPINHKQVGLKSVSAII